MKTASYGFVIQQVTRPEVDQVKEYLLEKAVADHINQLYIKETGDTKSKAVIRVKAKIRADGNYYIDLTISDAADGLFTSKPSYYRTCLHSHVEDAIESYTNPIRYQYHSVNKY